MYFSPVCNLMKDVLLIEKCDLCGDSHLVGLDIKKSPFASAGSRIASPKRFHRVLVCSKTQRKFILETFIFMPPEVEYISIKSDPTVFPSSLINLEKRNTSYFDKQGVTNYLLEMGIPEKCLWIPPGGIPAGDYNIIGIV